MTERKEQDDTLRWLSAELSELPDPEPAAPLFGRIMASRSRRRRRRRIGIAAALLLGCAALWPALRPGLAPAELELAAQAPEDLRLLLLDRRLQAAYDRGADRAEIAALWEARARLLHAAERQHGYEEEQDASILSL